MNNSIHGAPLGGNEGDALPGLFNPWRDEDSRQFVAELQPPQSEQTSEPQLSADVENAQLFQDNDVPSSSHDNQPYQAYPEFSFQGIQNQPDAVQHPLTAVHNGRVLGQIRLENPAGPRNLGILSDQQCGNPVVLTVDGGAQRFYWDSMLLSQDFQMPLGQDFRAPPQALMTNTTPAVAPSAVNDIAEPVPKKRKTSESSEGSSNMRKKKKVAKDAPPVEAKSAEHYAKAAEEPIGMTKDEENEPCLTCLKSGNKCKGSEVIMVKGQKRCQRCAHSTKSTGPRICYWKTPSRGVYTYEDAQQILAKELGGRVLHKNTRAGRIARQMQDEADSEQSSFTTATGNNSSARETSVASLPASEEVEQTPNFDPAPALQHESLYLQLYDAMMIRAGQALNRDSDNTILYINQLIIILVDRPVGQRGKLDQMSEASLQYVRIRASNANHLVRLRWADGNQEVTDNCDNNEVL